MPQDLFAMPEFSHLAAPDAGSTAASTPSQPIDLLAAQNNATVQPNPMTNTLFNPLQSARDLAAGVTSGVVGAGRGLIGTLPVLANALPLPQGAKDYVQQTADSASSVLPNKNWSSFYGVQNPNLLDKTLQFGASTLPFGGASVVKNLPEMAEGAGNLLKNAYTNIMPNQYAKSIIQKMGQGQSLEANAQSLAADIRNAFTANKNEAANRYAQLYNNEKFPDLTTNYFKPESYMNLPTDVTSNFGMDVRDMNNNFLSSPNFKNADDLQSQLGSEIRNLQYRKAKVGLDAADRDQLSSYKKARTAVQSDMNDYLNNADPTGALAGQYKDASQFYAQNVAPYFDDSRISQIAQGTLRNPNPTTINTIFKSPEADINKVTQDIGDQGTNKIIFNKLGQLQGSNRLNATNLLENYNSLDKQGLNSYVSPALQDMFDSLETRMKLKKYGLRGLGALGATGTGYLLHK